MEENYELDIMKLLRALRKYWPAVAASAVVCAFLMLIFTHFFSVPMYRAEAVVYISNRVAYDTSRNSVNIVDVDASKQVHSSLILTNAVLDKVAEASGLPYNAKQISRFITTQQIEDTAVLRIAVSAPVAEHCAVLANATATTGITEITKIAPGSSAYIIDAAEAPVEPYAPSMPKRVAVGFVIGALIAAAAVVVRELLDTKIDSEEELSGIIGAPVLGVIGQQKLPVQ